MRILVTGGMGHVGRPMVQWLLEKGHEVRVLDLGCATPIEGAECREGSITNFGELHEHMAGMEGVIHLAAYGHPSMASETELFHLNVDGTFNIFRAAADAGITRVVCASSINALGFNFGITFPDGQLRYFPIDEDHPLHTTDPYSFSKQMIEEIGRYFWRREGITSLFLRFPLVHYPLAPGQTAVWMKGLIEQCRVQTAKVMAMPEPQRSQHVSELVAGHAAMANARKWEVKIDYRDRPNDPVMMAAFAVMFGRTNFWTLLDARDAAQAAEKGLLAGYEGSHAVYITGDHNIVDVPSSDLVEVWFPDVTTRKRPLFGTETLVNTERVRALIGFEELYPYQ